MEETLGYHKEVFHIQMLSRGVNVQFDEPVEINAIGSRSLTLTATTPTTYGLICLRFKSTNKTNIVQVN